MIPNKSRAREIDGRLFWPLEDLDLLEQLDDARSSFVQSQSTSLFNNLANQTFTVVNNVQISMGAGLHDLLQDPAAKTTRAAAADDAGRRATGSSGNLFACIVDADVRHNFVTLGVNFPRDSANSIINSRRIPIEMSKRLQAKALFERVGGGDGQLEPRDEQVAQAATAVKRSREPRHLRRPGTAEPADPIKLTSLMMGAAAAADDDDDEAAAAEEKLDRSFWIALGNGAGPNHQLNRRNSGDFSTTATTLSIIIVLVFGSLLGLVFLTLKSYQRLTSIQFEYGLDDYAAAAAATKEHSIFGGSLLAANGNAQIDATGQQSDYVMGSYMMIEAHEDEDEFGSLLNGPNGSGGCVCQQLNPIIDPRLALYSSYDHRAHQLLVSGDSSSTGEAAYTNDERQPPRPEEDLFAAHMRLLHQPADSWSAASRLETVKHPVGQTTNMIENPLDRQEAPNSPASDQQQQQRYIVGSGATASSSSIESV